MKTFTNKNLWIASILTVLLVLSSCISEDESYTGKTELKTGDTLPDFDICMNDGSLVTNMDLKGKCSVIVFFHTQCPDCQQEFPILQRLYDERPYPFRMICISRNESHTSIQRYWNNHHLSLPYSAQESATVYHQFASSRIPRVYISNSENEIQAIFTDSPIASYDDLLQSIKNALQIERKI